MQALRTSSVTKLQAPASPRALFQPATETSWLQVLSHLSPQFGGIASSVPRLARATEAASSHVCPIIGFCDIKELEQVPPDQRLGLTVYSPNRTRWMVDANLKKSLKNAIRAATGVHIHGVWETHCMIVAGMARECKRPYLISVHGMLEQWALRQKRLKKALYAALIEIRKMQRAACLRALSVDEVNDYRRLGLTNPIAIIPNGIDPQPSATPDIFRAAYPQLAGKRIVLFLGRLHQKKGLELLLKAWVRSMSRAEDMHLVIAGPDSGNMRAALETLTDELELRSSVTFAGMLTGEEKWSAFAAASLFVLPSHSEGFSIAILEAMATGVPVMITTQCHIPEVAIHDCGWVIQPCVGALEDALSDFLALTHEETDRIGKRARHLVSTRFHSSVVGNQMAQLYDWLQGGNKPAEVEIV
ncbi:MAG: glycosyltransferase [Bryobacterales bacterium]|nr:glycosyltransferase [Bryobacterales bacterium]